MPDSLAHPLTTTGMPPMIGRCLTAPDWLAHLATVPVPRLPRVSTLVLHHTYTPTLASWHGLTTMQSMQRYYAGLGWESAPHIYVAPDGIWLFTPLDRVGIHANAGNGSPLAGWYSIGIEMVGRYDVARPAGVVWSLTRLVLGSLCRHYDLSPTRDIDPHRQYNQGKSCPGRAVDMAWVAQQVTAWLDANAAPIDPTPVDAGTSYTADSPILGQPRASQDQAATAILRRSTGEYTPYDVRSVIVPEYWRVCARTGVDPVLAVAQMIHETGNLTSSWSQRPRRNPAGIGVTGARGAGVSFETWTGEHGSVTAQVGRLVAYALTVAQRTAEQQAIVDAALAHRALPLKAHGSAARLKQLGKVHNPSSYGWASPGDQYGTKIAEIANAIRAVQV